MCLVNLFVQVLSRNQKKPNLKPGTDCRISNQSHHPNLVNNGSSYVHLTNGDLII